MLWHCHLLRPKHYLESCTKLLGAVGVLDHDPGYVSPKKVKGSTFVDKIELLYARERRFTLARTLGSVYGNMDMIQLDLDMDVQSFIMAKEPEDWLPLAFPEDQYLDEMECG